MENKELNNFINNFLTTFKDFLNDSKNDDNNIEHLVTISDNDLKIDNELKNLKIELKKLGYNIIPTNYSKQIWKIIKL